MVIGEVTTHRLLGVFSDDVRMGVLPKGNSRGTSKSNAVYHAYDITLMNVGITGADHLQHTHLQAGR